MLVVLVLAISSVSASEITNDLNSGNTILNSEDIVSDCSTSSVGQSDESNGDSYNIEETDTNVSTSLMSTSSTDTNDISSSDSDVSNVGIKDSSSDSNVSNVGVSDVSDIVNDTVSNVSISENVTKNGSDSLVTKLSDNSTSSSKVAISDIISSAISLKSYVLKYKKMPSTVTVGKYKCTIAEFSYLMSIAIKYLNSKKSVSTKIDIISLTSSNVKASIDKRIVKSSYLKLVNSIVSEGSKNKKLPSYLAVSGKKASFDIYTYAFAKILAFYKSNNRLPNYCDFDSSVIKYVTPTGYVTIAEVIDAADSVKKYVGSKYKLPSTVTVGNKKLTIAQFTYVESVAIKYIKSKKSLSTKIKVINSISKSDSNYSINKKALKSTYMTLVKSIITAGSKKKLPSYLKLSGKKLSYKVYTYGFAKILSFYDDNNRLPNYCEFKSSVYTKKSSLIIKKGINEYNTAKDLSEYLKASGHCKLNSALKSLAKKLTKNCKTVSQKAKAIFNYVKNNIEYSFYYDSKKNASGAYSTKKANCCDHANLIVALCRASGIPAKYSHAKCSFNSGLVVGHVWAQILVGNVWYVADATSTSNSLGHIKNWNINSMGSLKQYTSLPF